MLIKITKKMIFSGMSDLGIIDKETVPAETLHKVIQDILREQKNIVRNLINKNKEILIQTANYLIENEKIDGETFRQFLNRVNVA